jgi:hypothetical protein
MQIDFVEEKNKRDKAKRFLSFCEKFMPEHSGTFYDGVFENPPGFHCKVQYVSNSGNNVTVRIYPDRHQAISVEFNSKPINSKEYVNIRAIIYMHKKLAFLFCEEGHVMRTNEENIVEFIDWLDVNLRTPKSIQEVSQNTKRGIEKIYDIFYTSNVPKVIPPEDAEKALIEAFSTTLKDLEREKLKSELEVISNEEKDKKIR